MKSPRMRFGSMANCANMACFTLKFSAEPGETAHRFHAGNFFDDRQLFRRQKDCAMEIVFRTATRDSEPAPSTGSVISRSATSTSTSRNKLTATLKIESVARRLLRSAFLMMKVPMSWVEWLNDE